MRSHVNDLVTLHSDMVIILRVLTILPNMDASALVGVLGLLSTWSYIVVHITHTWCTQSITFIPASLNAHIMLYKFSTNKLENNKLSVFHQAIINSTISPNMTFTKTSQKFGQWADSRANTVYGLGFSTEHHLAKVPPLCSSDIRPQPTQSHTWTYCMQKPL